jgi:hypothetical protein
MRIVLTDGTGVYYARPLEMDLDLVGFTASMLDWPEDEYGSHDAARCFNVVRRYANSNLAAKNKHKSLAATTAFQVAMVVCKEDNQMIGWWRTKAEPGKHTHVSQIAIIPRHRGQGHLKRFELLFGYYHRQVLKTATTSFESIDSAPQVQHLADKFSSAVGKAESERTGKTGNQVKRHLVDQVGYESNADHQAANLVLEKDWLP